MDMHQPPAFVQMVQDQTAPAAPVEPKPVEVDVTRYIPSNAVSITIVVTVTPPEGSVYIYTPSDEGQGTLFKGPKSIGEIRLDGPTVLVKSYGATGFNIQYINYRQP